MDESPPAAVAVHPGTPHERLVPIQRRLLVGRDCRDDPGHSLHIEGETVSRHHLEIRLEPKQDRAYVIDTSTNGTRVNGIRIGRAVPLPLRPGDRIAVGDTVLEFRSERFLADAGDDPLQTIRRLSQEPMAMVVGDIVNYSTISQHTGEGVLMQNLDTLYGQLRSLLSRHQGSLSNYVGDAFFAVWEVANDPRAAEHAVRFALDGSSGVRELAPELALRDPDGLPVRMGWGVSLGDAAVSAMSGMLVAVVGDATNVAFRLAGLAGREGRAEVLVTQPVREAVGSTFDFGEPEQAAVKGRAGTVTVFGLGPH